MHNNVCLPHLGETKLSCCCTDFLSRIFWKN